MNTSDNKDTDAKVKAIMENATAKKTDEPSPDDSAVDLGALSVNQEQEGAEDEKTLDLASLSPAPKAEEDSEATTKDTAPEKASKPLDTTGDNNSVDPEDAFSQKVFRADKPDDLFDTFDQELESADGAYGDKYQKKSGTSFYTLMAGVAVLGGLMGAVAVYVFDDKPSDPAFSQTQAPVIRPVEATKVKPEKPGGMEIKNQDADVYNTVANKKEAKKEVQVVEPEKPALPKPSDEQTTQPIENAPKAVEVKPTPTDTEQNADAPPKTTEKPLALKVEQAVADAQKEEEKAEETPKVIIPANYALQLASVRSQDQAEDLWSKTKTKAGDLLTDKDLRIETINLKDKGDFFRVLATPFADSQTAKALCSKLKQKQIDCLPRKLKKQ